MKAKYSKPQAQVYDINACGFIASGNCKRYAITTQESGYPPLTQGVSNPVSIPAGCWEVTVQATFKS